MEIQIVGRHVDVHGPVRDYVDAKVSKLDRFYDQIQHIEVILSHDGPEKKAEMHITSRIGGKLFGDCKHEDFYAAIDLLMDKMSRQLKKQKEKLKVNHHKTASGRRPMVEDGGGDDEERLETYDEVIEKTNFIQPL